jgi:hypothetical protein
MCTGFWWDSQKERPRRRRKDGIRMDLRKTGWESVNWIRLAQDGDRWRHGFS